MDTRTHLSEQLWNRPETMQRQRLPQWLRNTNITQPTAHATRSLLRRHKLHSVCEEARCPNRGECFSKKTATFLILGHRCTRNCSFCAISNRPPSPPDPGEPMELARAVKEIGLHYVVVTSVTRDDLEDGGAAHFAATIQAVRTLKDNVKIEVLTPDFKGNRNALEEVLRARPDVFNHNVETVPHLYPVIRPQADYNRSLNLLRTAREFTDSVLVKSGLMVGLGETAAEIHKVMEDLWEHGCHILTIGQYLQPTRHHFPVQRYVHPDEFKQFKEAGEKIGLHAVFAGPLVRSSYSAETLFSQNRPHFRNKAWHLDS